MAMDAVTEQGCGGAWLPAELWDLILNGADSQQRAFFDPFQRVLLRPVCRRWRETVQDPAAQWVKGHLSRAWMAGSISDPDSPNHRAFLSGRLVTMRGALAFVCLYRERAPSFTALRRVIAQGLDPQYAASAGVLISALDAIYTPLLCATAPHHRTSLETECVAYYLMLAREHQLARTLGRHTLDDPTCADMHVVDFVAATGPLPRYWTDLDCARLHMLARRMAVDGAPITLAESRHQRKEPLLSSTLVAYCALDRLDDAVRHLFRSPRDGGAFWLRRETLFGVVSRMLRRTRDNVLWFFAILHLASHARFGRLDAGDPTFKTAHVLWRGLHLTCSLRCLSLLDELLQAFRNGQPCPISVSDAVNASLAKARLLVPDTPSFVEDGPFCEALCRARDAIRADDGLLLPDVDYREILVRHGDPTPLLAFYEWRQYLVERFVHVAIRHARGHALANLIMTAASQKRPIDWTSATLVPPLVAGTVPPEDAARWAASWGYTPDGRHLALCVGYVLRYAPSDHDRQIQVLKALAETWPRVLAQNPLVARRTLRALLDAGRLADMDALVRYLDPLFCSHYASHPEPPTDDNGDNGGGDSQRARSTSLWDKVARGQLLVSAESADLDLGRNRREPFAKVDRVVILARLAVHCDPARTDPHIAAAWRFWCGTPRPFEPTLCERSTVLLAECGLFLPRVTHSSSPDRTSIRHIVSTHFLFLLYTLFFLPLFPLFVPRPPPKAAFQVCVCGKEKRKRVSPAM